MALPWAVAIAIEWVALRRVFRDDAGGAARAAAARPRRRCRARRWPCSRSRSPASSPPGRSGSTPRGRRPRARWRWSRVERHVACAAVDLPLLGFVLGLGVIVRAVAEHGLGDLVDDLLPSGDGLLALLGAAALAAVLANLLNNVPRCSCCCPRRPPAGRRSVLAVLIGVNAGPNLTYTGSLATLLWRRVLRERDAEPPLGEFHAARRAHRAADPRRRYSRAVAA